MRSLPDEEVQRRLRAATARMKARANREPLPEEIDTTPAPMPRPATSAPPPAPWQDREPGEDDAP